MKNKKVKTGPVQGYQCGGGERRAEQKEKVKEGNNILYSCMKIEH
jgi:hypothetical protein